MADSTTKVKNDKKKAEELDDILLSDSDSSLPDIECNTCGVSFSSVKTYKTHLQSKRHFKKVAEAKFLAKNSLASKKNNERDDDDDDDDDDDPSEFHCEVCDKHISGYIPYASHLKGSLHAKNVKKQKLKQKLGDMPEVMDKDIQENDSDDDAILQKPYARCTSCQKEFSGPEPFNLHVKSSAHKKKVKQLQTVQILKAKYEDGTKKSDDEEFFSKCDVCQKSFSGLIPYQIHMESGAHKKSLEKKKVAEEIKQFCSNDDLEAGYVCKDCKKTFTDPLAFKSHLANNSHEKQKAKDALLEFLNSYPEIVFVTPYDEENSDESDADDSETKYYLICKLCHMSFSGPESAQDHVKSKKHISVKKEKKMLKLLKEQKKNSSVKSSDNEGTVSLGKTNPVNETSEKGKTKISEKSHQENGEDFEII